MAAATAHDSLRRPLITSVRESNPLSLIPHYEHRSILITANQPFGEWNTIFPDPAMTLAAVDRRVHHSSIFELNVESYRRRTAIDKNAAPDDRLHGQPQKPSNQCRQATINRRLA
jgi:hypothetical protein